MNQFSDDIRIYQPKGLSPLVKGILALVGGVVAGLFALAYFGLQLLLPPERSSLVTTLVPVLGGTFLAIGCAGFGLWSLVSPWRVTVWHGGLQVDNIFGTREIAWAEIARAETNQVSFLFWSGKPVRVLNLFNATGRRLAQLSESLAGYDELKGMITGAVSSRSNAPALAHKAAEKRRSKARWNAVLAFIFGPLLAAAGIGMAWHTWSEITAAKLMAATGIDVQAEIIRHYKFNVTPRLEYAFVDQSGKRHQRDAMMATAEWQMLAGQSTVTVRYLPGNPVYSRLSRGEVSSEPVDPMWQLPLCLAGLLLGLAIFGFGFVQWRGWDFVGEGGKLRWKHVDEEQKD
jgi:hypothetical protein